MMWNMIGYLTRVIKEDRFSRYVNLLNLFIFSIDIKMLMLYYLIVLFVLVQIYNVMEEEL